MNTVYSLLLIELAITIAAVVMGLLEGSALPEMIEDIRGYWVELNIMTFGLGVALTVGFYGVALLLL